MMKPGMEAPSGTFGSHEAQSGIEAKLLKAEGRQMFERAQEAFQWHVENLEQFELLFEDLQGEPEYTLMRSELLQRIHDAGTLMDAAERQIGEDDVALKTLES